MKHFLKVGSDFLSVEAIQSICVKLDHDQKPVEARVWLAAGSLDVSGSDLHDLLTWAELQAVDVETACATVLSDLAEWREYDLAERAFNA